MSNIENLSLRVEKLERASTASKARLFYRLRKTKSPAAVALKQRNRDMDRIKQLELEIAQEKQQLLQGIKQTSIDQLVEDDLEDMLYDYQYYDQFDDNSYEASYYKEVVTSTTDPIIKDADLDPYGAKPKLIFSSKTKNNDSTYTANKAVTRTFTNYNIISINRSINLLNHKNNKRKFQSNNFKNGVCKLLENNYNNINNKKFKQLLHIRKTLSLNQRQNLDDYNQIDYGNVIKKHNSMPITQNGLCYKYFFLEKHHKYAVEHLDHFPTVSDTAKLYFKFCASKPNEYHQNNTYPLTVINNKIHLHTKPTPATKQLTMQQILANYMHMTIGNLDCTLPNIVHRNQRSKDLCSACNKPRDTSPTRTCEHCQRVCKVKNFIYHDCSKFKFNQYTENAWIGDAEHHVDVIKYLQGLGYKADCSATILTIYISSKAQVNYLLFSGKIKPEDLRYSDHKLSTYFEHLYHTDADFKECYQLLVLNDDLPSSASDIYQYNRNK